MKITRQIHTRLINRKQTISTAESCTGGLLASFLTNLPGSSAYFILGVVTYSNKSKEIILGIPAKTIRRYGAVSAPVARLMAVNIRKEARTNFGLSITGIAGPSGSTPTKSVGTVYICLSAKNKNTCRKFNFPGKRQSVRKNAVQEALRLLYAHLPHRI